MQNSLSRLYYKMPQLDYNVIELATCCFVDTFFSSYIMFSTTICTLFYMLLVFRTMFYYVEIYAYFYNKNYSLKNNLSPNNLKIWTKKIIKNIYSQGFYYRTPANFNSFWNFGFILFVFIIMQIISGAFLAMYYIPSPDHAFDSIEHIVRDVDYGAEIRNSHANGASFIFINTYLHISRNLFYRSYAKSNFLSWVTGIVILILFMLIAFIGYVLPWGQMSFWGATVITSMFSSIPYVGEYVLHWIWGGHSVSNPTLTRLYSLHYLLPFLALLFVYTHISLLHLKGSTNPSLASNNINESFVNLYPYFILKDCLGLFVMLTAFFIVTFFYPDMLGHTDNYIKANPLITPSHIQPEWYYLPSFTFLRVVEHKLGGVILMLSSIVFLLSLPFTYRHFNLISSTDLSGTTLNFIHAALVNLFIFNYIFLGWLGQLPLDDPFYYTIGICSVSLHFICILLIGLF